MRLVNFSTLIVLSLSTSVSTIALSSATQAFTAGQTTHFSDSALSSTDSRIKVSRNESRSPGTLPTNPDSQTEKADIQPEPSTENESRDARNLGVCSAYVPPDAKPDSFEYREGIIKCQHGDD